MNKQRVVTKFLLLFALCTFLMLGYVIATNNTSSGTVGKVNYTVGYAPTPSNERVAFNITPSSSQDFASNTEIKIVAEYAKGIAQIEYFWYSLDGYGKTISTKPSNIIKFNGAKIASASTYIPSEYVGEGIRARLVAKLLTLDNKQFERSGEYESLGANNEGYSVILNKPSGGNVVGTIGKNIQPGTSVTLFATPNNGYKLISISASSNKGRVNLSDYITATYGSASFVMPAADVKVTAKFEKLTKDNNAYKVTVKQPKNGKITGANSYLSGDTVVLTATPDKGYKFVSWTSLPVGAKTSFVENGNENYATFVMPVADVKNVSAVFELTETYGVSLNVVGSGGSAKIKGNVTTYKPGDLVSIEVKTDKDYIGSVNIIGAEFDGRYGAYTFVMPNNKVTVNVSFKKVITVEASYNSEQGSVVGTGSYNPQDKVKIIVTPYMGYSIKSVSFSPSVNYNIINDGENSNVYDFKMPNSSVKVKVTFQKKPTKSVTIKYPKGLTFESGVPVETHKDPYVVGDDVYLEIPINLVSKNGKTYKFSQLNGLPNESSLLENNNYKLAIFKMPNNNLTLTAVYKEDNATSSSKPTISITPKSEKVESGTLIHVGVTNVSNNKYAMRFYGNGELLGETSFEDCINFGYSCDTVGENGSGVIIPVNKYTYTAVLEDLTDGSIYSESVTYDVYGDATETRVITSYPNNTYVVKPGEIITITASDGNGISEIIYYWDGDPQGTVRTQKFSGTAPVAKLDVSVPNVNYLRGLAVKAVNGKGEMMSDYTIFPYKYNSDEYIIIEKENKNVLYQIYLKAMDYLFNK